MGKTRNERRKRRMKIAADFAVVLALFWFLGLTTAEALTSAMAVI